MKLPVLRTAKSEGATEALKATDQLEWVCRMNGVRRRAEEIRLDMLTDGQMKEI